MLLGADVDGLLGVAVRLEGLAADLEALAQAIPRRAGELRWHGRDADRLRDTLSVELVAPARRAGVVARDLARRMQADVAQQRHASRVDPLPLPHATVLRRDRRGDGRVIEVLGDLETASRVVVQVPGMSTRAAEVLAQTPRSLTSMWTELQRLAPGEPVAIVFFLDYDPPDLDWTRPLDLLRGASSARAEEGAESLTAFVGGLVAEGVSPASITVIGHSYGSVVVGRALSTHGLPVGRVAVIGSPGMGSGIDRVEDLGRPDVEVFAACAVGDLVCPLPVHGADPSDAGFGAIPFRTDGASGHSRYYSGTSLTNLALIALGREPHEDPAE